MLQTNMYICEFMIVHTYVFMCVFISVCVCKGMHSFMQNFLDIIVGRVLHIPLYLCNIHFIVFILWFDKTH